MTEKDGQDLVIELSGLVHLLESNKPITDAERKLLLQKVRSARDQFLNPHLDPRIRSLELWVLVLVESSESMSTPRLNGEGPPANRTRIIDPIPFHLAVSKLHELHNEGLQLKQKRKVHAR